MPANPLHFLAIAPLHYRRPEIFDLTALLLSSTLVDLELLFQLMAGQPMAHGLWHSYLFVLTIYPAALSLMIYAAERRLDKGISRVYGVLGLSPHGARYPLWTIFFSSLVGGVSHVFLDMWTHEVSAYVLYPLYRGNLFWIGEGSMMVHVVVAVLSSYTLLSCARRIILNQKWFENVRPRKLDIG